MNGRALALGSVAVLGAFATLSRRDAKVLTLGVVTRAAVDDAIGSLARAGDAAPRITAAMRRSWDALWADLQAHLASRAMERPCEPLWVPYEWATEWAEERRLPVIGIGSFRVVLRVPRQPLVVKIDIGACLNEDGEPIWFPGMTPAITVTRNEAQRWSRALSDPGVRDGLVPVLAADPGGRWLAMPLVEVMPGERVSRGVANSAVFQRSRWVRREYPDLREEEFVPRNLDVLGRFLDYGAVSSCPPEGEEPPASGNQARAIGSLARAVRAGAVSPADRTRFDAVARDARVLFREAERTGYFSWDDVGSWGKARGLSVLGSGMHRAVFRDDQDPRRVLKVNIYDGKSSRSELHVWRTAPDWLRPYLVPVLGAGKDGRWILMEYAKPAKPDASRAQDLAALPPGIAERMMACGLSDLYAQNMAADGRLLDYGYLQHDAWKFCTKGIKPKHTWITR